MVINLVNTIIIGEDRIEHGLFKRGKKDIELLNFSHFKFDVNDVESFKLIANSIKDFSDKDKFTLISFSLRDMIKDIFPVKGNPKDLKMDIYNHLMDTYMVDIVDYNIDYSVSYLDDLTVVYSAMLNKSFSEPIFKALQKEGFKMITAETDCDSLARICKLLVSDPHYLHLHIRKSDSNALIIKDGKMLLERYIKNGIDDIIENLSISMGIENRDAESIIFDKGFDENKVSENELEFLTSSIDRLTIQIQRTLDLYFQTYRFEPVSSIILTGEGTKIPYLDKYWSNIFAMPVRKEFFSKFVTSNIDESIENLNYFSEMIGLGFYHGY